MSEPISGHEAERIGLVSFCVPDVQCMPRALDTMKEKRQPRFNPTSSV